METNILKMTKDEYREYLIEQGVPEDAARVQADVGFIEFKEEI